MFDQDSPFGPLPTNLPRPIGLPMPTGAARPQQPMIMAPEMPQPASVPQAQASEFEKLIGGLGGLLKQSREDTEAKQKASDMRSIMEQLVALKRDRGAMTPEESGESSPGDVVPEGGDKAITEYMRRNAMFESGDNLDATNAGSGASGIYQFLPSTWRGIMREAPNLGLTEEGIRNRDQQNKAMRYYTGKSQRILAPLLGRNPTGGELYLLHLLGHSGGPEVLRRLDEPITSTISAGAYKGNPFLKQYTTGRDLIAGLNKTFGGSSV